MRCGRWSFPGLILWLVLVLVLVLTAAGALGAGPDSLADGGTAVVAAVIDGETVALTNGRQVRLVGVLAPRAADSRTGRRSGGEAAAFAAESRTALAELVLRRTVALRYGGTRIDRYGRALAHLVRDDGLWVQGEMLRRGLVRVCTSADNPALAAEMLALEAEARAARRGLWASSLYSIRTPGDAGGYVDSFQIVEGRVLAVASRRGWIYVNFGPDWRTDFTLAIAAGDRRVFAAAGLDSATLVGARLRVRGWLTARNGPMIEATHPQQVERLPDPN